MRWKTAPREISKPRAEMRCGSGAEASKESAVGCGDGIGLNYWRTGRDASVA
jgi:hypothetical protein